MRITPFHRSHKRVLTTRVADGADNLGDVVRPELGQNLVLCGQILSGTIAHDNREGHGVRIWRRTVMQLLGKFQLLRLRVLVIVLSDDLQTNAIFLHETASRRYWTPVGEMHPHLGVPGPFIQSYDIAALPSRRRAGHPADGYVACGDFRHA